MTARQIIESLMHEAVEGQTYIRCRDGWISIAPAGRGGSLISSSLTRREFIEDSTTLYSVVQDLVAQLDGVLFRRRYSNGRWQMG